MSELKKLLRENFYTNWRNFRIVRIVFPALVGVAAVLAFCLFIYVIGNNPWVLIIGVLAAVAVGVAVGVYKAVNEAVEK